MCARGGLSVDDLQAVTDGLLDAGASIDEINTVRRACSAIKGGGLAAAAAPATVVGVLVSDVVGDDPSVIASGPTVPTGIDPDAALAVLDRYDLDVAAVRERLAELAPSEPADVDVENHIIASGRDAIDAARDVAEARGYEPCVLSTRIEGEAAAAGRIHAAIGAEAADSGDPVEPPAIILSGGETIVRVTGDGVGGPNGEFVLAAASGLPKTQYSPPSTPTAVTGAPTQPAGWSTVGRSTIPRPPARRSRTTTATRSWTRRTRSCGPARPGRTSTIFECSSSPENGARRGPHSRQRPTIPSIASP